jgi:hypothetical protein
MPRWRAAGKENASAQPFGKLLAMRAGAGCGFGYQRRRHGTDQDCNPSPHTAWHFHAPRRAKAVEGHRTPGGCRVYLTPRFRASVPECASPLALWARRACFLRTLHNTASIHSAALARRPAPVMLLLTGKARLIRAEVGYARPSFSFNRSSAESQAGKPLSLPAGLDRRRVSGRGAGSPRL